MGMLNTKQTRSWRFQTRNFGLTAVLTLLAGCAASPHKPPPAKIEIQDDVGFTITEEAGVSGATRERFQAAHSLLAQQQNAEAIELLKKLVSDEPLLSAPRIDLAIAYQEIAELALAEEQLTLALEQNPRHPVALNELGIVYRKTGRFAEARASYEKSLAVYPGFHIARRNLAVLCDLYLGDLRCALDNYEAYMETVTDDPDVAIWIADVRYRLKG
jgi:Flp pilus assembly protein TadD